MSHASETAILRALFVREIDTFVREIEALPEDRLWQTAPGLTNSAGNLGLHLAGNLLHFVGACLGQSGYVRHRDREFSARSGTRAEVVAELTRARDVVTRVVPSLSADALAAPFPEAVGGVTFSTRAMLAHLTTHAAMHLGQLGYLRRVLTGNVTSMNPVSVREIANL